MPIYAALASWWVVAAVKATFVIFLPDAIFSAFSVSSVFWFDILGILGAQPIGSAGRQRPCL